MTDECFQWKVYNDKGQACMVCVVLLLIKIERVDALIYFSKSKNVL